MRLKPFTLAVVVTAAFAGCGGGGSDEDQVRKAASDFTAAFAEGDMKRACELMTSDAKKDIVSSGALLGGGDCAKIMGVAAAMMDESDKDKLRDAKITKVTVKGNTAEVVQTANLDDDEDEPMRLTKRGDHWLVDTDAETEEADAVATPEVETAEVVEEATPEPTPTETPMTTVAEGDKLSLSGYDVTVLDTQRADELPGDEYTDPVKADGEFMILTLKVRNSGKEVATFSSSLVELLDADGTAYSAGTGGGESQIGALPDYLDMRELQPKSTETGKIAFDLPTEANVTSAQFADSLELFSDDFAGVVTLD